MYTGAPKWPTAFRSEQRKGCVSGGVGLFRQWSRAYRALPHLSALAAVPGHACLGSLLHVLCSLVMCCLIIVAMLLVLPPCVSTTTCPEMATVHDLKDVRQPSGPIRTRKVVVQGKPLVLHADKQSQDMKWILSEVIARKIYGFGTMMVPPGSTIVELGGNIGIATVVMATFFPTSTILTFEPMPRNFEFLLWNLKENGIRNVYAHNLAISHDTNPFKLTFLPMFPGSSGALKGNGNWRRGRTTLTLRPTTFQCIRNAYNITELAFMKIDCEGCEYAVVPALEHVRVGQFVGEVHDVPSVSQANFDRTIQTLCGQPGHFWGQYVMNCCLPRMLAANVTTVKPATAAECTADPSKSAPESRPKAPSHGTASGKAST